MQQPKQPKIVQKLLLRTFFLLMSVAAIFLIIQKVLDWRADPDSGSADTSGMIAAVQILDEGQQAVIFDKTGQKITSPGYESGKSDRDIAWLPDGNRLYFVSDRRESAYNLYRWNTESKAVDPRSSGSLSRFDPSFLAVPDLTDSAAIKDADNSPLLVQGGFVIQYDLKNSASHQLLPPPGGVTQGTEEGDGGTGQFDTLYKKFGNSFKTARWGVDKDLVAAVMKRDVGELLIVQKLNAADQKDLIPLPLMGGEHVFVDVAPKTGVIVFTVQAFEFVDPDNPEPQFVKNGKAIKPFSHGVFAFDPAQRKSVRLVQVPTDKDSNCFGPPSVSPDGSQVVVTTGTWDGTDFKPAGMIIMPVEDGGIGKGSLIAKGEIYEPSWHPNGHTLVYVKRENGKRGIYTIEKDGSGEKKIADDGNYMQPKFSPQSK